MLIMDKSLSCTQPLKGRQQRPQARSHFSVSSSLYAVALVRKANDPEPVLPRFVLRPVVIVNDALVGENHSKAYLRTCVTFQNGSNQRQASLAVIQIDRRGLGMRADKACEFLASQPVQRQYGAAQRVAGAAQGRKVDGELGCFAGEFLIVAFADDDAVGSFADKEFRYAAGK